MNKADLHLDWCSYQAAKYAVEHWHYSRSMPTPPVLHIGVWECGQFIGVVLFSRGANSNLGKPYGLKQTELCELTRIALTNHSAPVSRIVSIALKMLRAKEKGLRLVVSYADANHNHHGGIYQASGWLYSGCSKGGDMFLDAQGKLWHSRQVSNDGLRKQYGTTRSVPKPNECERIKSLGKFRYLYPLDSAMRARIAPLAKPYPKRGTGETDNAPQSNVETGGASPTVPLLETP